MFQDKLLLLKKYPKYRHLNQSKAPPLMRTFFTCHKNVSRRSRDTSDDFRNERYLYLGICLGTVLRWQKTYRISQSFRVAVVLLATDIIGMMGHEHGPRRSFPWHARSHRAIEKVLPCWPWAGFARCELATNWLARFLFAKRHARTNLPLSTFSTWNDSLALSAPKKCLQSVWEYLHSTMGFATRWQPMWETSVWDTKFKAVGSRSCRNNNRFLYRGFG